MSEKTHQHAKVGYFKGAMEEIRKVTWPTKKQAVNMTIIVLVFCLVSAVFLGLVDLGFAEIYKLIINSK